MIDATEVIRTRSRRDVAETIRQHQDTIYEHNSIGAAHDASERVWNQLRDKCPAPHIERAATHAAEEAAKQAAREPLVWVATDIPRRLDGKWTVMLRFPDGRADGELSNDALLVAADDTVESIIDKLAHVHERAHSQVQV